MDRDVFYASCSDNTLWKMNPMDKIWVNIGQALNVISLAAGDGKLYALDKTNNIWVMSLYSTAPTWMGLGKHTEKIFALAATNKHIYATTKTTLLRRSISKPAEAATWKKFRSALDVVGLAYLHNELYACCSTGQMWMMDLISQADWSDCGKVTAFSPSKSAFIAMDTRIFAADGNGKLWFRAAHDIRSEWQQFCELPKPACPYTVSGGDVVAARSSKSGKRSRDDFEAIRPSADIGALVDGSSMWKEELVEKLETSRKAYEMALKEVEEWRESLLKQVADK